MGLLRDYRRSMRRRNLRPGTIDKRLSVVRRWLAAGNVDLEAWLDELDVGARTRYGYLSHLHRFYTWAIANGYATTDPTLHVERPRLPRRLPRPARADLVDVLLAGRVDAVGVAVALMVDAGLRCCEVAQLTWSDVRLGERRLYVSGKGGHDRVVGIPTRLVQLLAAVDDTGPVMGRPMSAARVSQLVNRRLRDAGVGATAHQLRHLYATRLLAAAGGNLLAVQQALGHQSVTSTQIYARVDPTIAVEAAENL